METLRQRREALGLTQQEVADQLGTTKTYWSEIERGQITLPKPETRQRICRVLGIKHIDLLVLLGVLADWEVPGFTPAMPHVDPQQAARHALLDQLDLQRDNRGRMLDTVLQEWAAQDRRDARHPAARNGTP